MVVQQVGTGSGNQLPVRRNELKSEDFIRMMITQLQYQDPLKPASNQELMAQMSQIGQLQASTQLQQTLKTLAMQNQIGTAGNLIGKMVQGLDENNDTVRGIVTSVRVEKQRVYLELDNGKTLPLENVTNVAAVGSLTGRT